MFSSEKEQTSNFSSRDLPLLAIPLEYELSIDSATPPPNSFSTYFTFVTPIFPPQGTPTDWFSLHDGPALISIYLAPR